MPGPSNNFSNELHSYLGGSYDGNAVLGLPFAAYLNFGIWVHFYTLSYFFQ